MVRPTNATTLSDLCFNAHAILNILTEKSLKIKGQQGAGPQTRSRWQNTYPKERVADNKEQDSSFRSVARNS